MQSRYPHWLKRSGEGQWPTGIICVDCESHLVTRQKERNKCDERLLSWHCVGMVRRANDYGSVVSSSGRDIDYWWCLLSDQAKHHANLWVVSYRCARVWSLLGLWERIEDGRIDIAGTDSRNAAARALGVPAIRGGYLVCEDPPCILQARVLWAKNPVTWIDVRNHGVEKVGEVAPGHATADWLARWVKQASWLCRKLGLGALSVTAGSQAMRAFRHSYYHGGIYVDNDADADRLITAGYHGGRCEARRLGTIATPHYHLDIRSSYGAVCVHHRVPVSLQDYCANPRGENPTGRCDPLNLCATVQLRTTEPAYPYRRRSTVLYPTGRFTTVLCGPELEDALHHGRIEKWGEYAEYKLDHALRHYALCLYDARNKAELSTVPGIAKWIKRMLVSLPGKLGQRSKCWVDAPDLYTDMLYDEWLDATKPPALNRCRVIAGLCQREIVGGFAADAVPAAAAWVTSWGRMALLQAIRVAGWDEVYYYDTDSLFCSQTGYAALLYRGMVEQGTLGALEVRGTPASTEIRGIKYYVQDGQVTCAGLPRGETTDLGDGDHYTRRLSPAEQARAGQRPEAIVIYGTYQRTAEYELGTVNADGTVTPICLWED